MRYVVGAVVAATAVWFVADVLVGADLAVRTGDSVSPVGPFAVVLSSLVAALAGWGLYRLLVRRSAHGRRVWTVIAVAVFVVSLLGPLSGVDNASRAWLALMHLAVAAVLIPGLRATPVRTTPDPVPSAR